MNIVHTYMSQGRFFFFRISLSLLSLTTTHTTTFFVTTHPLPKKISFHFFFKKSKTFEKRCDMEEETETFEKSNDESKIKVWVRIRPPIRQSSQVSLRSHENSIQIKKKTYTYVFFFRKRFLPFCFPNLTI